MHDFQKYPYLHRFRPNDDNGYTIDEISNSYVYFQSRTRLNDPFDCYPGLIQIKTDDESLRNYLFHILGKHDPAKTRQQKRQEVRKNHLPDKEKLIQTMRKSIAKSINSTGITCFTRQPSNLMMWSHYANQHKGICLQYNIERDPEFFALLKDVNYEEEFSIMEFSPDIKNNLQSDAFEHLFFTKSEVWVNEQEVRLIKDKTGAHPIRRDTLTGIFFGMDIDRSYKQRVIEVSCGKYSNLEYWDVIPSKNSFGISIKKLKDL